VLASCRALGMRFALDDINFGRWYAGAAARRFKTFAEFKPIGDKYLRLQAIAADLCCRISTDASAGASNSPEGAQSISEGARLLQKASDDLLTGVGRLIRRVAPSVSAPTTSTQSRFSLLDQGEAQTAQSPRVGA